MFNKRLLTILLVFIFVGGLGVSMSLVLRVQEIKPDFTNTPNLILKRDGVSEDDAKTAYRERVESVAKGKNILFSLDREAIKAAIEEDSLVRVTNIEAKFPNKLEIKIQERYPMYKYNDEIYDYELKKLDIDADLIDAKDKAELIKIDECPEALVTMGRMFFNQGYDEKQLRHLIQSIEFDEGDMIIDMKVTEDVMTYRFITIKIKDFGEEFGSKLAYGWTILQDKTGYYQGELTVDYSAEERFFWKAKSA